jgi:uncharacterized membrane protein YfcA
VEVNPAGNWHWDEKPIAGHAGLAEETLAIYYSCHMTTFLFLLAGLLVGILSGMIGLGGGVFIIPILVYGFKMSQHKAQGTSLGALLAPIGLLAFMEYYKAGNVDIRAAIMIAIGFLIGGYFGGRWAQLVSDTSLRRGFAILLIAVGIQMLVKG